MSARKQILDGLTEPQRRAVTHMAGPLLVVAGAGSGKTRVITRRVAYLASQGVPPQRLLAVTFTNKAAGEMRERIEALAGTGGAWMSTFHSLCASMLRFSAEQLGLPRSFSIYDRDDQLRAVREAMQRLEMAPTALKPAVALHKISAAKNQLLTPSAFAAQAERYDDELAARVYTVYQKVLEENAALDFDDLLTVAADRLGRDAAFRERWQQRFDFVLIDEYQDTNRAQYLIARHLAARHRNLCATGDADQAIYGWRGADIRNILGFQKDYPDAVVIKLEQNYRSTQVILDAASSLIARNVQRHERDLWTENPRGKPVTFHFADGTEAEAAFVVRAVRKRQAAGRRLRDFAVFYRTNAQSRAFEEALRRAPLPYCLVGAIEFYARQEIKDLLATLRVLVNERDELSLLRILNVPPRGLGDKTLERVRAHARQRGMPLLAALAEAPQVADLGARAQQAATAFSAVLQELRAALQLPVAELCSRVLERTGYQEWLDKPENKERRQNVQEFLNHAAQHDQEHPGAGLPSFLQEVALVSDVDNLDESADAVTLMTLHAAKGLEFPVVFLTGLEEGLLPHYNAIRPAEGLGFGEDAAKVEEERRLCYVGMTRAKEELVLTAAAERTQFRADPERVPSRFLGELSSEVFDAESRETLAVALAESDAYATEAYQPVFHRPRRRPGAKWAPAYADVDAADAVESRKPARPREAAPRRRARPDLAVGDWVIHAKFGEGQIVAIQPSGKLTLATLALRSGGKRVFALEVAPIQKL
jgi:DNA helicase-2/ATP-dependent DNA helicase PcrA